MVIKLQPSNLSSIKSIRFNDNQIYESVYDCDFNKYNFKIFVFRNCIFEIATF
jgi:hypothetical protein